MKARQPTQRSAREEQEKEDHQEQSHLSPERITDGASATTDVLKEILAQEAIIRDYHRHWGINE